MRKILIGLGNPGKKYENTYHNAGALAVEKIFNNIEKESDSTKEGDAALFHFCEVKIPGGEIIIFARPKTFMNESGIAVKAVLKYFRARQGEVIIFHDDSDLILGVVKISESKNLAGHHGLISIQTEMGGMDFKRVRIGIRNPSEKVRLRAEKFVLNNIPKTKMNVLLGEALNANWSELRKKS